MTEDEIKNKIKQMMEECPLAYFSKVFSNKNPDLRAYVLEHSKFLDGKVDPKHEKPYAKSTRIIYALNGFTDYPKCKTCGGPIKRNLTCYDKLDALFCCNRCAQKDPSTIAKGKSTKMKNHGDPNFNNMDKNKQTCRERYGVDYAWQSDRTKEASKKTLMEHFGVDHQMRSSEVVSGMRQRYKEKHGVEHMFQDPEVVARIKAKNQKNYGVDYPMQSKELHKIMHDNSTRTQKTNYFNNVVRHAGNVIPMFEVEEWLKYAGNDPLHEFLWKCTKCGKEFNHKIMYGSPLLARCYDCYPVNSSTSLFEKEIAEYLNSLGNGVTALNQTSDNKKAIPPYEIDIVVKKDGQTRLFIEADGLFWHSVSNGKDKLYHVTKTDMCNAKGIQLVHIFEDEWNDKKDIVKSRLQSLLGIYSKKVFARKCTVKEISHAEAKDFFNKMHIQGSTPANVCYGLVSEGELVSAMSFGYRRKITNARHVEGEYEMLRFASRLGYHVIGAAGKLLAHFERECSPKLLVSYADRRWSQGKLYNALGFTLDHISSPNYWYLSPGCHKRLYRFGFRKSVLPRLLEKFDPNKTEMENMLDNGYNVIWDCGNYVFKKTYN